MSSGKQRRQPPSSEVSELGTLNAKFDYHWHWRRPEYPMRFQSITTEDQHKGFSFEEHRLADYKGEGVAFSRAIESSAGGVPPSRAGKNQLLEGTLEERITLEDVRDTVMSGCDEVACNTCGQSDHKTWECDMFPSGPRTPATTAVQAGPSRKSPVKASGPSEGSVPRTTAFTSGKFYAVHTDQFDNVYSSWVYACIAMEGRSGIRHRRFSTPYEAWAFLDTINAEEDK